MSVQQYLVGLLVLAAAVVAPVIGARRVRARWFQTPTGASRALTDATIALGLVLVSAYLVGAFGLLSRGPLAATSVVIAAAAAVVGRSPAEALEAAVGAPARQRIQVSHLLAVAAVVVVLAQWISRTIFAYRFGITDYDSLAYHLPHAAEFARSGSLTGLHPIVPGFPHQFHPSGSELLHAVGLVAFDSDILSPALNLLWLALALLAAWVIGATHRVGLLALLAAAVVAGMPFAANHAGSAGNDVPAMACLLAAGAFLVHVRDQPRAWVLVGWTAGIAVSVKLTMLAPVAVLAAGAVVLGRDRLRTAVAFGAPLAALGSFWYARNVVHAGNPLPSLSLGPLPTTRFSLVDRYGYSLLDYLGANITDASAWSTWVLPALGTGFSPAWPGALGIIAAGLVVALWRGDASQRLMAVVVTVGLGLHLITPTTAFGTEDTPILMAVNLRYVLPVLALGLVLSATVVAGRPALELAVAVALASLVAGNLVDAPGVPGLGALSPWAQDIGLSLIVAAVAVAVAALLGRSDRVPSRSAVSSMAVLVALAGLPVAEYHAAHRYQQPEWRWIEDVGDVRIAVAGIDQRYPLYGSAASNDVFSVGRPTAGGGFEAYQTCSQWRAALAAARPDLVVVAAEAPGSVVPRGEGDYVRWMEGDPLARELKESPTQVFRYGDGPPAACP